MSGVVGMIGITAEFEGGGGVADAIAVAEDVPAIFVDATVFGVSTFFFRLAIELGTKIVEGLAASLILSNLSLSQLLK